MANTLDKLIAEGAADPEELTIPEGSAEPEMNIEPDADPVVGDADGDIEVVLTDDDQGSSQKVEVPVAALGKLRRQKREAREERDSIESSKNAEIELLRAQLKEVTQLAIKKPEFHDFDSPDDYDAALLRYNKIMTSGPQVAAANAETTPAPAPQRPNFDDSVNSHYDRAEKLGVNLDRFANAEKSVREQLGDFVTDALIDTVGDGSERVMMFLGENKSQLKTVKDLFGSDQTGLKAIAHCSRLAEKLEAKKSSISKAPAPTRSPSGSAAAASTFQKQLDKAEKAGDVQEMTRIRRQARKAGETLE